MPFQKRVKSDKTKEQYKAEFQAGLSAVKKAPKGTTKKQIVEKAVLQLLAILGKDTANVKYNITNLVALFVCNVTGDVLGSVPYNMSQNLWLNTIQPILRDHANDAEFSVCVESGYYGAFFCKKEYRETRAQKKEGSSTKVSEETTARIAKALEALK